MNGFIVNTSGEPVYSFPSGPPTSPQRPHFARAQVYFVKGCAAGVWCAPEKIEV